MTIEEILEALQAIIDGAAGRDMTDEEVQRYEQLEADLTTAQEAAAVATTAAERTAALRSRHSGYNAAVAAPPVHTEPPADDTLERAFNAYLRTGEANADLVELRAQSAGNEAGGGYTVPPEFREKLVDRIVTFGGLANLAESFDTTSGAKLTYPSLDDTGNEGVIAGEGSAPGSGGADLEFDEVELGAYKYTAPGAGNNPLRVSVELLQDSAFDVDALVRRKLGERVGRIQSRHWMNGTGTNQPTGILPGTVGNTQNFTGATISKDTLIDATYQIDEAYQNGAAWVFNRAVAAAIHKLEDTSGRPLLQPSAEAGLANALGFTLFGYPIVIDSAGGNYSQNTTFGAFGNFREAYVIRRVSDISLVVNPYTRAHQGEVEYTLHTRADGNVQEPHAYTRLRRTT